MRRSPSKTGAPMVMGYISRMAGGKQMDPQGLHSLIGEQSKMAMQSSPEAATMATQLLGSQKDTAGVSGIFKKFLGN